MFRVTRTALRTAWAREVTARPARASWTTKSSRRSFDDAVTTRSPSIAGPSAVAQNVSPRIGSWTAPAAGRPSTTRPTDTQNSGSPLA